MRAREHLLEEKHQGNDSRCTMSSAGHCTLTMSEGGSSALLPLPSVYHDSSHKYQLEIPRELNVRIIRVMGLSIFALHYYFCYAKWVSRHLSRVPQSLEDYPDLIVVRYLPALI
jgi:hypothetical protein